MMPSVATAFLSSDQLLSSGGGLEQSYECRSAVLDIPIDSIRARCVVFGNASLRMICTDRSCVDFCRV